MACLLAPYARRLLKGVEATGHLVGQANVEALIHPHIWLRGLLPLSVPDPLDHSFKVQASYEHLDVSGKFLGGDGGAPLQGLSH